MFYIDLDTGSVLEGLMDLALQSGVYTSNVREWRSHLSFCLTRGWIWPIHTGETLIGFATWYKTNDPVKMEMQEDGAYVVIDFLFVLPSFRNQVDWKKEFEKAAKENYYQGKLTGITHIIWKRGRKSKTYRVMKLEGGTIRWVGTEIR